MSRYNLRSSCHNLRSSSSNVESSNKVPEVLVTNKVPEVSINNQKEKNEKEDKTINLMENYLMKDKVFLEDVDDDGACLYECLSRGLNYNNNALVINKKSLMNICREYINIHQNKIVYLPNDLKMKYKELIETTHDMTIENYVKKYTRVTSKNWGGLPEIIAVSELFDIEINVYIEDNFGYRKEYTIPIQKKKSFEYSIDLLLDLSDDLAHYQLIIQ